MLVQRREHEKKENGTDDGLPLTATAIAVNNPLETLPRSRPCNRIVSSMSCEAKRTYQKNECWARRQLITTGYSKVGLWPVTHLEWAIAREGT